MIARGKWPLWQGFNYGGRYTAPRTLIATLIATCLASPNGLADYRLATIGRMMDKYAVDGMYLDDNLAYANCPLWKEHGHPQQVYDCLIELHDMNWRRRQLLREKCPHAVLIEPLHRRPGAAGDLRLRRTPLRRRLRFRLRCRSTGTSSARSGTCTDKAASTAATANRSAAPRRLAYNYDLLTGGGQYNYTDRRLYPEKFPYAKGVTKTERLYVETYNRIQYYFGLYEAEPYLFRHVGRLLLDDHAPVLRDRVPQSRLERLSDLRGQHGQAGANDLAADSLAGKAGLETRAPSTWSTISTSARAHGGRQRDRRSTAGFFHPRRQPAGLLCAGRRRSGRFTSGAASGFPRRGTTGKACSRSSCTARPPPRTWSASARAEGASGRST